MNAPEAPWPAPDKSAARAHAPSAPAPAPSPAPAPAVPAAAGGPAVPAARGTAPGPASPGAAPGPVSAGAAPETLVDRVIGVLKTCFDPEIPLNIYDLSLIYGVEADPEGNVNIKMTLTSPSRPVAGTLPGEVQQKVAGLAGVRAAHVDLVWDPPWDPSRLSEAARLTLGLA